MSVADHLRDSARRSPAHTALIAGDLSWTYSALDEHTDRIAAGLRRLGLRPGDRIALHMSNRPELVLAYYAAFKTGAVCVPVNNRFAPEEIRYSLNHSGCRICISQPDLFSAVDAVRSELPCVERFVLTGEAGAFADILPFDSLVEPESGTAITAAGQSVPDDQPAVILYTSGTTSRPKGVTHTHQTLTATASSHAAHIGLSGDDILCIIPPMCHILGFATQLVAGLCAGATLILPTASDPQSLLETIQRHRVTRIAGLPVMYQSLVNFADARQFSLVTLRTCIAGGDAVPLALQEQFRHVFNVTVLEGCGMTEVIPFALNVPGQHRPGSIGRACPGAQLRLVDDSGQDVADGEPGEILVQSAGVMTGYWREPELTAVTLAGGFMHTGDLARRDPDGYYWFVGRKKEIIIRGGSNISPLEVEDCLYQHPAVRECGVVGAPDVALGEVVWAWVAVRGEPSATADDLQLFLNDRIAAYKIPERILFLDELPKGLTGKINRRALREKSAAIVRGDLAAG